MENKVKTRSKSSSSQSLSTIVSNSLPVYEVDLQGLLQLAYAVIMIKAVVNHGILARCHSAISRNVMFLVRHYNW